MPSQFPVQPESSGIEITATSYQGQGNRNITDTPGVANVEFCEIDYAVWSVNLNSNKDAAEEIIADLDSKGYAGCKSNTYPAEYEYTDGKHYADEIKEYGYIPVSAYGVSQNGDFYYGTYRNGTFFIERSENSKTLTVRLSNMIEMLVYRTQASHAKYNKA